MRIETRDIKTLLIRIVLVELFFGIGLFSVFNFINFEYISQLVPLINNFGANDWILIISIFDLSLLLTVILHFIYSIYRKSSSLITLINQAESEKLEFKSSLRWDFKLNKINKDLEITVAKIIVGFLNTSGGVLIIGINDNKEIVGIESDINSLPRKNQDSFVLHLSQILNQRIGINYSRFIKIKFAKIKKKALCIIEVDAADQPAYLKKDEEDLFFIRVAALTQPLKLSEAVKYIEMHWI